ncbi:MAG: hypothetical protein KDA36_07240, partial [Planctomycetaceae bacterium]|nr:hypothetical protein [Planctomycetaceae bacterium]
MARSKELWRTLKIGDKVRIPDIPPEFLQPGYFILPETMEVYRRIVARRRPVRVAYFDEYGFPWII